ncbi:MAG: nitric oxide reductase [Rhodocyclaceae bacterium]|nr:MAG: nitric oxide reductase [Rhodocyclaceae bacterium]
MEEWVGGIWDRFITRIARREHPEAAVTLPEMERTIGMLFRAFGGDAGVRVVAAAATRHGARRRLIERIAGSGEKTGRSSLDAETLRLPEAVALFPERATNRDLYIWLAVLAATAGDGAFAEAQTGHDWFMRNQLLTARVLSRYPALLPRYRRLIDAVLATRPEPEKLPADEAARERAIRAALANPGSVPVLPAAQRPPLPLPLWLHMPPAMDARARRDGPQVPAGGGGKQQKGDGKRRAAERVDMPERESPFLLPFRAETLLSWAEFVKVNRELDDEDDPDAGRAADDLDKLTLTDDAAASPASRIRFDLDLPAGAADDVVLEDGILLPEWDWKRAALRPDFCRLMTMTARDAEAGTLPARLRRPAARIRRQLACLAPARSWLKAQPEGEEIDIDACVRGHADRCAGSVIARSANYRALQRHERDLACLVLADLSLSTDAWIGDEHRVIDVIRDSLLLFGEALAATGDRFAMYGFSSLKRSLVRFHEIKTFAERFDNAARGRIAAIKPGYYTRLGAALRQATTLLAAQPAKLRPLLIVSDGKPHDIDHYEGRYGIEDTRMAVIEARRQGLKPFCITIDREGEDYLPHMFGPAGYTVVRQPEDLALRLPALYAQLTR